jgi:hypothetical protein
MTVLEQAMSAITLDETLYQKLPTLHESTEIRDAAGKVLGVFTPIEGSYYNQQIPQHILDKIDWDEVERRANRPAKGRTTDEVLKRLAELEKAS